MSEQSVRVPVNKLVPFMEDACVAMGVPGKTPGSSPMS